MIIEFQFLYSISFKAMGQVEIQQKKTLANLI